MQKEILEKKPIYKEEHYQAGPKSQAMFAEEQNYISPGLQQIGLFSGVVMEHGEGPYWVDVDGRKYLDLYAGVGVASLGHAHPKFVKVVQEQVSKIAVGSFATARRIHFLKTLASVTPKGLKRAQLYSGGAETVEAALRLAKSYTKKYEFVSFWGGFHGKTMGVMGFIDDFKRELGPLNSGAYRVPYGNCYRCPFKMEFPQCGLYCAEFVKKCIAEQTTKKVAAIIMEPIQGTGGNVVPPKGYVAAIAQIAREENALLILDEIITGFGRTGKMFACEHENITPDIMTVGKGMGCGLPVSGLISTDEIINSKPFANPSGSSSSFGGNPIISAACDVTLQTIIEDKLVENSRVVGEYMLNGFKKLQEKYGFIGDVRGRGLMIGVELVADRKTKESLPKHITRSLFDECLKRGVMSMCYGATIRINPPLIITKAQAEEGLAKFDEGFAAISKKFNIR
ncbi:MAG: aspartate aminotransferase family protein [Elusimicrobia bacterium]|nr:aspartate aminotransferase family protein [Elusimicrobiota bacterium]